MDNRKEAAKEPERGKIKAKEKVRASGSNLRARARVKEENHSKDGATIVGSMGIGSATAGSPAEERTGPKGEPKQ